MQAAIGRRGGAVDPRGVALRTLPRLLPREPQIGVVEQRGDGVAHRRPVLIGKWVGTQVNIRPPECLL